MDKYSMLNMKLGNLLVTISELYEDSKGSTRNFLFNFQEYLQKIQRKAQLHEITTHGASPGLFMWISEANVLPENTDLWNSILELDEFLEQNF